MENLSLTHNAIKSYFEDVLRKRDSGEEFPVSLNYVWPICYSEKGKAVRALTSEFIEVVDYQVFTTNGKNLNGGRPENHYKLSLSCLEFFIARKVRSVFEVYRMVFHKAITTQTLPDFSNPAIAARAWADQFERAQAAEKTIEETRPMKELAESVLSSNDTVTVGEFAKALGAGPNKLFQWMRDEKLLIAHGAKYNLPFQKYLDAGYFDVVEKKRPNSDKLDFQTMITTKGQLYLTSRYKRS